MGMGTPSPGEAQQRTVAFIDDDRSIRDAACALLRSNNVCVEVFASAEDFLRYTPLDGVACVVVDIRMPGGMSGFDLQNVLARQGRSLPTVFISSRGYTAWVARATTLGATFLYKPFSENALIAALERVCGKCIDHLRS
jgi:FixJ family two-component response regulator